MPAIYQYCVFSLEGHYACNKKAYLSIPVEKRRTETDAVHVCVLVDVVCGRCFSDWFDASTQQSGHGLGSAHSRQVQLTAMDLVIEPITHFMAMIQVNRC